MTNIPAIFLRNRELSKCVCGQPENMTHIYNCKTLNSDELQTKYEKIYSDNVEDIEKVYKRLKRNMQEREILQKQKQEESHVTFFGPLFSVPSIVNGIG